MLLLDTTTVAQHDRAETFQVVVSGASSSNLATFDDPADVHARLDLFSFGLGRVFNVCATGNTLRRTPKVARAETEQAIALAVPVTSQNRLRWGRARADLASRAGQRRTISSVARSWGFSDASFFASRFRRAYGLMPRQWQQS